MKRLFFTGLCFLVHSCLLLAAQNNQGELKPLKIGDRVPDVAINNITNYSSTSAKLSDFKGKLVILDFWATWCGSCLKIMPDLSELQSRFKSDIIILAVTEQSASEVSKAMRQLPSLANINFPIASADSVFKKLFPHNALPHDVVIGPDGLVKAITRSAFINPTTISNFLNKSTQELQVKSDRLVKGKSGFQFLDEKMPEPIAYGIITGKIPGAKSTIGRRHPETGVAAGKDTAFLAQNMSLVSLYVAALDKFQTYFWHRNRILLNMNNPEKFRIPALPIDRVKFYEKYAYCMEVSVSAEKSSTLYPQVLHMLESTFNVAGAIEKQTVPCYIIQTIDSTKYISKKIETISDFETSPKVLQNMPMDALFYQLNILSNRPVVNETGFSGRVTIKLFSDVNDFKTLKAELEKFGMLLTLENRVTNMIVLEDIEKSGLP